MTPSKTLCFAAGGSGGHIIPCLTLAYRARIADPETNALFFTGSTQLEADIIKASSTPVTHRHLHFKAPPYARLYLLPVWLFTFVWATVKSFYYLIKHKPSEVISTGSHIALPVCVAAKLLRIPVTLYELNVEAGKTTRFLAPLTTSIKVCFPETKEYFAKRSCAIEPYPIKFTEKDRAHNAAVLRTRLGIPLSKKVILVLGGSQGSIFLNSIMPHIFSARPAIKEALHIVHQTGSIDPTDWRHWYNSNNISAHAFSYSNEILLWYTVADLILCRSGAGTLAEIVYLGKPCITIPLETKSNNHQMANAYAYQKHYPDTFVVVRQGETLKAERAIIQMLSLQSYYAIPQEK
jgi:UDP-N-acetylglucosamine--N-acetylmuramyl-(pentapeptide) pyrophosphoryl-undecaprenol N-acetylglucosamine transferase